MGVVTRSVFGYGLLWTDEAAKIALAVIGFIGGAAAYRDNHHAVLQVVLDRLPPKRRAAIIALTEWLVILVAVILVRVSLTLLVARSYEVMSVLQISGVWAALPLTIGMVLLVIYAAQRLSQFSPRLTLPIGAGVAVLAALVIFGKDLWLPWMDGDTALYVGLLLFLATVLIGVPVGFAMLLATLVYLFMSGSGMLVAAPQNMLDGIGRFLLLALPFFILAGVIMEQGGISLRLVRFVQTLIGHFRGGMLQVLVASMYLVSGLSGAKIADVAAVGSVMRDVLRRENYALEEGAAVLAVSAAMGETIPPSIAMLLLGSITSVSIGSLFVGGLMPAAVVALCIMLLIYVRARRTSRRPTPRADWLSMGRAGIGAILPLLMPVILFAGILSGVGTPTEVSSFAVVYGLLLAVVLYREMSLRQVWRAVVAAAILSGMVLLIVAAASTFAWILTIAQLPQRLIELISGHDLGPSFFLLCTVPLMIVAGSIVEGLPAILILAPLLMPIAVRLGINPVHYSMVLLIAMGTGSFMPPVGIGFYICCAVCGSRIEASSRAMVPYLLVLIVGLLIVAFVPWVTLALPDAFGLAR
jgi:tripartite ATP-independent transporter DctM subunit